MKQHINITLTEEEYELITRYAEKADMRHTEFCKYARLGKDIKAVPPAEIIRILRELADVRTSVGKLLEGCRLQSEEKENCEELIHKLMDIHYAICALYLSEN